MADTRTQQSLPGLVHEAGDFRRLGGNRQRAGLDTPLVQQVRNEADHVIGLLVDDPEERHRLRRIRGQRGAQDGGRRALDRHQRRPQLVAHHAEEVRPHPLQFLEWRQILHGDHDRLDLAVRPPDRGAVDQHPGASPVRHRNHDLLRPHRLAATELLRQRQLAESHLASVGPPERGHLQQLLHRLVRQADRLDNPPRFAIDRLRPAGPGVEHHHADR